MRGGFLIAVGLTAALSGCGWSDSDEAANPRTRGPSRPAISYAKPATQPAIDLESQGSVAKAQPEKALKAPVANLAVAPEEEKPKRDLSRELRAALGMPGDCLRPRTGNEGPLKVTVDVEAHLVESGLVTRAYASSGELSAEEVACIQKRASAIRLAPPIEESPRSVSTTIEFKFAAPPPKAP